MKNKIINISILLVFTIFISNFISASSLTNTTINNSNNLTINITNTIYFDQLDINNTLIKFYNLSRNNGVETITFTINESNKNYTGANLPFFSTSNDALKTITSNITSVNGTIIISSNCDTTGRINYVTNSGINYSFVSQMFGTQFTCSGNLITFNLPIENGTNTFYVNLDGKSISACTQTVNAFASYAALLGLLGTVIFLGLGLSYLVGLVDKERMKQIGIVSAVVTLIMLGVLIIIAVYMINTLCTVL